MQNVKSGLRIREIPRCRASIRETWWPTAAFEKLQNGSQITISKVKLPSTPIPLRTTFHESVSAIHSAAGRHFAADGRNSAGGHRRLLSAAGFGAAGSRLPDDSGAHVLSRRQPGRDGDHRHGAAGTPVRRDAGPQPDDLDQRRRRLGHRAAVQPFARASTSPRKKCSRRSTAAQTFLPSDLPTPPVYNKTNPADAPVLTLAITSPLMPLSQVEDMVDTRLAPSSRS